MTQDHDSSAFLYWRDSPEPPPPVPPKPHELFWTGKTPPFSKGHPPFEDEPEETEE